MMFAHTFSRIVYSQHFNMRWHTHTCEKKKNKNNKKKTTELPGREPELQPRPCEQGNKIQPFFFFFLSAGWLPASFFAIYGEMSKDQPAAALKSCF